MPTDPLIDEQHHPITDAELNTLRGTALDMEQMGDFIGTNGIDAAMEKLRKLGVKLDGLATVILARPSSATPLNLMQHKGPQP